MTMLMGVDGCTGGWIAAVDEGTGRPPACRRYATIAGLMERAPAIAAIDVPIGLPERGSRACDIQARALLGARRSSVFPAPVRAVLTAGSHAQACARRFEIEGKKITLQAWGIVGKVAEVDKLLREHAPWRSIIREVHPELCFYELNGRQPMAHGKKRPEGRLARMNLLRPVFADALDEALARRRLLGCAPDDIIDAFAALWSARRIANGVATRLPGVSETDSHGIAMEMWA